MPRKSTSGTKARKKATRAKAAAKKATQKKATKASARKASVRRREAKKAAAAATTRVVETGAPPEPPAEVLPAEARGFEAFGMEVVEAELQGTAHCPNCRQLRPAVDFLGVEVDWSGTRLPTCTPCRENGTPHVQVVAGLDPRVAMMIRLRVQGLSHAAIGRQLGCDAETVRLTVSGETVKGQAGRNAFKIALAALGIDAVALAAKGVSLLDAQKALSYKGELTGEVVDDNATQLGAMRTLALLMDLQPPKQHNVDQRSIVVMTNLDTPHPESRSGVFEATVVEETG